MLGRVVVDEVSYPIDRIFLDDGDICINIFIPGDVALGLLSVEQMYIVFDPGGNQVFAGAVTFPNDDLLVQELHCPATIFNPTFRLKINNGITDGMRSRLARFLSSC